MIHFVRAIALGAALGMSASAVAQNLELEAFRWTLEEFQTTCIPLWPDEITEGGGECTVAEFGEIVELDGTKFYYARYHDRSRPEPGLTWPHADFNAVVIIGMESNGGDRGFVASVVKERADEAGSSFRVPSLIQTMHGPVLYVQGWGWGKSRYQYLKDRYFLWQSGAWSELDTISWTRDRQLRDDIQEVMPEGFTLGGLWLDGIWEFSSRLRTMTYGSPVSLVDDPSCCPSGGWVRFQFEVVDFALQVAHFEYSPPSR